jgi:flagellar protein FlbD
MITLTRLSGQAFVLNSDLIERVDSTPDSVVTLVDGKKYVVKESLTEIIDAVREYRSTLIAVTSMIAEKPPEKAPEKAPDRRLAPVASLEHGED